MPTPQVVDRFNVDGQDYAIEPVLDPIPSQDSPHAVASGGVFADKSNVPVEGSTKNFTAAGAFDFFADSTTQGGWLSKALDSMMFRKFETWTGFSDAYSTDNTARFWGAVGDIGYGARDGDRTVVCSLDGGDTWQDTVGLRTSSVLRGSIFYGDSKWLAIENTVGHRYLAYSTDGVNFQETTIDLNTYVSGGVNRVVIKWVHDRWFVILQGGDDVYKAYYTTDLQELHLCGGALPSTGTDYIWMPAYGDGVFVCTVNQRGIYSSTDGVSFAQALSDTTNYFGAPLYVGGIFSRYAQQHTWITLRGVNDNNTKWKLMITDDPVNWASYSQYDIAPATGGCIAYEFNGVILIGVRMSSAIACQGLFAFRPQRRFGDQFTPIYSGWEMANLQIEGHSFGSIENIGCINGTWFVFSQAGDPSNEATNGWRISNDLEHWELIGYGSDQGYRYINYWKERLFLPVDSSYTHRIWKVSSAKTLLKEFAKQDKFIMK